MKIPSLLARKKQPFSTFILVWLCVALVSTSFGFTAQALQDDSIWSPVVNLSNAGSSYNPSIITGSDGVTHVMWFDQFAGNRYTHFGDGEAWSVPTSFLAPFREYQPRLLINELSESIFAFWLIGNGNFYASRALNRNMSSPRGWESQTLISQNVVAYDAVVDEEGIIHLIYITAADEPFRPSGVYYVSNTPGVNRWNAPRLVYASQYFRGLEDEDAPHASIVRYKEGEGGTVTLLAWDDPAQKKIEVTRSMDGGKTWEDTAVLNQGITSSSSTASQIVDIVNFNNELMLFWQEVPLSGNCQIYFQTTTGTGKDWNASQVLYDKMLGCPTSFEVLGKSGDSLLVQAMFNNQVYLIAWNGQKWSTPQLQISLSSIQDTKTSRTLAAGCHQFYFLPDQNRLDVARCDIDGSLDIWYTSMKVGDTTSWFSATSTWDKPQQLYVNPLGISGLNIVASNDGEMYALWSRPPSASLAATENNPSPFLMYSSWKETGWSEPVSVIRLRGLAQQLRVALDRGGNLLATWRGKNPGQILFSRSSAQGAFSVAEWSEAIVLPSPSGPCISPVIITGEENEVFVAYAIPANEGRGIYFNHSLDNGRTWSDPVLVFDGQNASWEMVDQPVLARTTDGRLHALWLHQSLMSKDLGLGIGYAYSDDQGATWNTADTSIEGDVRWAGMIASTQGRLFRVWHEVSQGLVVINSQVSTDSGDSWQAEVPIATSAEITGTPRLITDPSGNVHLLQMSRNNTGKLDLLHWVWEEDRWVAKEDFKIEQSTGFSAPEISGAFSSSNVLAVMYTMKDLVTGSETLNTLMGKTVQNSAAPEVTEVVESTATPADAAPTSTTPTEETTTVEATPTTLPPTIAPTPTLDLAAGGSIPSSDNSTWVGLMIGIVLAIVIVVVYFTIRVYRTRSGGYKRREYLK